jgi:hypothetical protein
MSDDSLFAGTDPGLVGLEAYTILRPLLRKRIQNDKYNIRYESECLFRMRKEITTNNKFLKVDKDHKHQKIQKNNIIFLLTA